MPTAKINLPLGSAADLAMMITRGGFQMTYAPVLTTKNVERRGSKQAGEGAAFLIDKVTGFQHEMVRSMTRSIRYDCANHMPTKHFERPVWEPPRKGDRRGQPIVDEGDEEGFAVRVPSLGLLFAPGERAPAGFAEFLVSFKVSSRPSDQLVMHVDIYDVWLKRRFQEMYEPADGSAMRPRETEEGDALVNLMLEHLAHCVARVTRSAIAQLRRLGLREPPRLIVGYASDATSAKQFIRMCAAAIDSWLPDEPDGDEALSAPGPIRIRRYELQDLQEGQSSASR